MAEQPNWLKNSYQPLSEVQQAMQLANAQANAEIERKRNRPPQKDIVAPKQKEIEQDNPQDFFSPMKKEETIPEEPSKQISSNGLKYPIPGTLLLMFNDFTNYGLASPDDMYDENKFILFSNFHIVNALDYSNEEELKEALIEFHETKENYIKIQSNIRGEHYIFSGNMVKDISVKKSINIQL